VGSIVQKKSKPRQGRQKTNERFYLSPLTGLILFFVFYPRFQPWAILCRTYGAGYCRCENAGQKRERKIKSDT
jgi:hypothetical protein